MTDPRVKRLAEILVNYSIKIKKRSVINLSFGVDAKELALEVYKLILKKGAYPIVNPSVQGFAYAYYKNASKEQLNRFPKLAMYEAKMADGEIHIGADYNTREFTKIDPKKIALRRKITQKISDINIKKNNWVVCKFPTNSLAQDSEMSLEEFEDFVYDACLQDWEKESKKQEKLKRILDKGKRVRITADDTDLSFSIAGRQGIKCSGTRNMPDGEVFIAPVEDSTEGYIKYTYPAMYGGREVGGIYLRFHKGKVVEAKAEKGEGFLKQMIKTDAGAVKLGEFGIGVNYNIKQFIKQILFDEKIGGTVHLALGMAYPEGGGKNKSAIHWDMIKDLRKGGKLFIDGKLIQKDGQFTFKL
ncbi:aminopeptidase [Candidatus Woesearchaeota archaeon]|nr:aminopeptidase [Candidatus Woesearchaeota archaeon]